MNGRFYVTTSNAQRAKTWAHIFGTDTLPVRQDRPRVRETCDGEALLRALVQLPDGAPLGDPDPEPGTVWGTVRSATKVQLMAVYGEPVEFTVGERQFGKALLGNVWRRQLLVGPN